MNNLEIQSSLPEKGSVNSTENLQSVHYCDFGCGQIAHYQLKNGKWCCCKSYHSCPELRRKNSESITKAHKEGRILTPDIINKLKQYHPWNYGKKKPKIYHPGKCEVCGKDHDGTYGSGRFCSQKCANKIGTRVAKANQKLTIKSKLNYQINPRICKVCGKPIPYEYRGSRSTCGEECHKILIKLNANSDIVKNKIAQSIIRNGSKIGGYRPGSGNAKSGWYKGYHCDSSWELAFVIYNLDHNIWFDRYDNYFEYQWNNQTLKYYPDFMLNDGTLIEIKGCPTDQWLAKLKSVPSNFTIKVLGWIEIQPYLKYATEKYGVDFTKLYENKSS